MSFDLTSLHPMLMNQYNISPECIRNRVDHVNIDDYVNGVAPIFNPELTTAANGMQYTKEFKGVIPIVALKVFNTRVHHKNLQQEFKQKAKDEKDPVLKAEYLAQMTLNNVIQMAAKIQINSLYGSLGSPYFRYYDVDNAEAVTVSSQLVNRWIERYITEYLNSILPEQKERAIAGDTDSVTGDTVIEVNGKRLTIEEFYDSCNGSFIKYDIFNNDYVKACAGVSTPAVTTNFNKVIKPITYVMKHKVKKRMFRITAGDKSVVVTEDHSVMVKRGKKLISVQAKNIKKTDVLIINKTGDTDSSV